MTRLETLVDAGSFEDVGILVGEMDGEKYQPVNLVVGTAKIQGTACVVASDDFGVAGGTYSVTSLKKKRPMQRSRAIKRKMPLIRFLEGGGCANIGSQAQKGRSGYDFTSPPYLNVLAMQGFSKRTGGMRGSRPLCWFFCCSFGGLTFFDNDKR